MSDTARERSLSFGSQAAAYERGRPSYPPEAIDWLLAPTEGWAARDVLDLGAGTGKLTTRLVERGLDVIAVDPIAEMLDVLRAALPTTPALLGTAFVNVNGNAMLTTSSLPVGNNSLTASYEGNSNNQPSTSPPLTVTVNKATPAVNTWPTASAISYGQTLASSTLAGGSGTRRFW